MLNEILILGLSLFTEAFFIKGILVIRNLQPIKVKINPESKVRR